MISKFVLGPFLQWLPSFVYLVIWGFAAYWYFEKTEGSKLSRLLWFTAGFDLLYAAALTYGNYYLWQQSPFDRILLHQPLNSETPLFGILKIFSFAQHLSGGYFIFYTFTRYWLPLVSLAVLGLAFFLLLSAVRKFRPEILDQNDLLLALIMSIIAGWPTFIIFLPLAFAIMLLYAIFNQLVLKRQRSDLGSALLAAGLLIIIAAPFLAKFLIPYRT